MIAVDRLLDTNFLSSSWRGGRNSPAAKWLRGNAYLAVRLPWIVKGEFLRGAAVAGHQLREVRAFLDRFPAINRRLPRPVKQRNHLAPQAAVNTKIFVERPDSAAVMQLAHPDHGGIGQRNVSVMVFLQQGDQSQSLACGIERNFQRPLGPEPEEGRARTRHVPKQEKNFADHGLGSQQRAPDFSQTTLGPFVVLVAPVKECDQRAGVGDDNFAHRP
jgi:hypothetical protein